MSNNTPSNKPKPIAVTKEDYVKLADEVREIVNTPSTDELREVSELFWKFHNDRLKDPSLTDMTPYIEPILGREQEAYKRGYAKGGVDEILRHEQASQAVEAELKRGEK